MQHRAHRSRRTPHHLCDLLKRVRRDQVQESLLLRLCPWPIAAPCLDSQLPHKSPACISRVSRGCGYPRDKRPQRDFLVWPAADRLRGAQVSCYDLSRSAGPAKPTTLDLSIRLIHIAAGLWKTKPTTPSYLYMAAKLERISAGNEYLSSAGENHGYPGNFSRQRPGIVGFCWRRNRVKAVSIRAHVYGPGKRSD